MTELKYVTIEICGLLLSKSVIQMMLRDVLRIWKMTCSISERGLLSVDDTLRCDELFLFS